MKRTRFWIILLSAAAAASAAGALWVHQSTGQGTVANLYQNGVLIRSIDLSQVREPEVFTIEGPIGGNTIQAEQGRIRVSSADCPDQICVRQGWLADGVTPIVCLPNQLVIRVENGPNELDLDGAAG